MSESERSFLPGGPLKKPDRARVSGARETNQHLTTEAHVQQTVKEFLELDGWRAIRTDPVSDRSRGKGFGEVGMPDYLFIRYLPPLKAACLDSAKCEAEMLWIEFKRKGQFPKAHQIIWHEAERKRGALVMVVDDIDEFIAWYKNSGLARHV